MSKSIHNSKYYDAHKAEILQKSKLRNQAQIAAIHSAHASFYGKQIEEAKICGRPVLVETETKYRPCSLCGHHSYLDYNTFVNNLGDFSMVVKCGWCGQKVGKTLKY
jgi:hypothetical protein